MIDAIRAFWNWSPEIHVGQFIVWFCILCYLKGFVGELLPDIKAAWNTRRRIS